MKTPAGPYGRSGRDPSLLSGARTLISGRRRNLTLPNELPNLWGWWRLGTGITVTGAGVSSWADQSGNGRDLLQGTDANRPQLQGDGTILFDGVAHFLQTGAATLNSPLTIYLALRQITWTINELLFDGRAVATQVRQDIATPSLAMNGGVLLAGQGNLAINTYGALACVFNGANSRFHVNFTAPVTGDAGSNAPAGFTIGAARTAAAFCNCQYKEAAVFSEAHEPGVAARLLKYFMTL